MADGETRLPVRLISESAAEAYLDALYRTTNRGAKIAGFPAVQRAQPQLRCSQDEASPSIDAHELKFVSLTFEETLVLILSQLD